MRNYAKNNNGIDGLRYFGHSFNKGLAVNMGSGISSIYSGGLGWVVSWLIRDATRLNQIDPQWFKDGATVSLYGCDTATGKDSFAEELSKHLGLSVTGAQSGTYFSGKPGGKFGEGLPNPVPDNYTPVYLVPWGSWKTFPVK